MGDYEKTVLGLPAGIPLTFEVKAFDGVALTGNVIFTAPMQIVTLTGPIALTFNLEAAPVAVVGSGLPHFGQLFVPSNVAGNSLNDIFFGFTIVHAVPVLYTITVSAGTINGSNPFSGSFDPNPALPQNGRLDVKYAAIMPADLGAQTIAITLTDPADPDITVTTEIPFTVVDTTTTPTVRLGPAITAVNFFRTATDLTITVTIEPGFGTVADPAGYVWSGTGTFVALLSQ